MIAARRQTVLILAFEAGINYADRLPRNRVVFWSLIAWSLVTVLSGFALTAHELLATRVLLGLAECFYVFAAIALIADHHPVESCGRALSLPMCGLSAGLVGGGALSDYPKKVTREEVKSAGRVLALVQNLGYLKADWGLRGVFANVGLLVLMSVGLVWLAKPVDKLAQ